MDENQDLPESWIKLWRLEQERSRLVVEISNARWAFIESSPDRVSVLRAALDRGDRGTVLRTIEVLPEPERRPFLPDLVRFASIDISDIFLARNIILSLDRAWTLARIEPLIWAELGDNATDEQFRRLAELAAALDERLLHRIAERALSHDDPEIREVGRDYARP